MENKAGWLLRNEVKEGEALVFFYQIRSQTKLWKLKSFPSITWFILAIVCTHWEVWIGGWFQILARKFNPFRMKLHYCRPFFSSMKRLGFLTFPSEPLFFGSFFFRKIMKKFWSHNILCLFFSLAVRWLHWFGAVWYNSNEDKRRWKMLHFYCEYSIGEQNWKELNHIFASWNCRPNSTDLVGFR